MLCHPGQVGEVIVVSGPPGAGKSTVAGALADLYDPSALVAGDDFFAFLQRGLSTVDTLGTPDQVAAEIVRLVRTRTLRTAR